MAKLFILEEITYALGSAEKTAMQYIMLHVKQWGDKAGDKTILCLKENAVLIQIPNSFRFERVMKVIKHDKNDFLTIEFEGEGEYNFHAEHYSVCDIVLILEAVETTVKAMQ